MNRWLGGGVCTLLGGLLGSFFTWNALANRAPAAAAAPSIASELREAGPTEVDRSDELGELVRIRELLQQLVDRPNSAPDASRVAASDPALARIAEELGRLTHEPALERIAPEDRPSMQKLLENEPKVGSLAELLTSIDDEQAQHEADRKYLLWTHEDALRVFGKPDFIQVSGRVIQWTYQPDLERDGVELEFFDGVVIDVDR